MFLCCCLATAAVLVYCIKCVCVSVAWFSIFMFPVLIVGPCRNTHSAATVDVFENDTMIVVLQWRNGTKWNGTDKRTIYLSLHSQQSTMFMWNREARQHKINNFHENFLLYRLISSGGGGGDDRNYCNDPTLLSPEFLYPDYGKSMQCLVHIYFPVPFNCL